MPMRPVEELLRELRADSAAEVAVRRLPRVGASANLEVARREAARPESFEARCGGVEIVITREEMDALLGAGAHHVDRNVDRIASALRSASLPSWVADTRVEIAEDPEGKPAAFVSVVVRSGEDQIFRDGESLSGVRRLVQEAVDNSEVDLWPYVRFVSEAEAA